VKPTDIENPGRLLLMERVSCARPIATPGLSGWKSLISLRSATAAARGSCCRPGPLMSVTLEMCRSATALRLLHCTHARNRKLKASPPIDPEGTKFLPIKCSLLDGVSDSPPTAMPQYRQWRLDNFPLFSYQLTVFPVSLPMRRDGAVIHTRTRDGVLGPALAGDVV